MKIDIRELEEMEAYQPNSRVNKKSRKARRVAKCGLTHKAQQLVK